jgi:hypothetical protein
MGNTRSALVLASMVALGLSPGTVLGQPYPGGLPACLASRDLCYADLNTCQAAREADAATLASCTSSLTDCNSELGTCAIDLQGCDSSLTDTTGQLTACTADLGVCNTDLDMCMMALDACNASGPTIAAQLLATGQTTCWDAAGGGGGCRGTGQDGEVQAGAALGYTDNGDGTITDNNTKLMWAKKSRDGTIHDMGKEFTWAQAFAHVAALNAMAFAGYSDWRLPNVRELQSIVDYGQSLAPTVSSAFNNSCGPGATPTILTGSCTAAPSINSSYWTSTTVAHSPSAALAVVFWDGLTTEITKGAMGNRYVRAVRGGL